MYKKILMAIVAIAMISMMFYPVFAWEYPNKSHDTKDEMFGPRTDQLLIQLYASETSEWETGLATGQIDITDWPLDYTHLLVYNSTASMNVFGYGAEFGAYLFDLNQNNNTYLGNPPNPAYPNPMYPNAMGYSVAQSGVTYDGGYPLRHALAHLVNRAAVISQVGAAAATAIYTPAPPCYGKYADTEILPGGAREDLTHPYDPTQAADILNSAGIFPIATSGPDAGWRVWVRNGVQTHLELDLVARVDHVPRLTMAQNLRAALESAGIKIHVKWNPMTITAAKAYYMLQKKGHIYTAGWSLGLTPDSLILWNWAYYWHSPTSSCYDTSGCNKDAFNTASDAVQYANSQDDAVAAAWAAQISFTQSVLGIAVYANSGFKAMSKAYVGAEAGFHGLDWQGMINYLGYGIDNFYTFLNMHATGKDVGGTIRYGFKTTDIRQFNPVYTEWLWDNTVIDLIGYDSLVARDPYSLAFIPWVAKTFALATYTHPTYGLCNKMVFSLRNDVYFQDGVQLTAADAYYTFVEMKNDLAAAGLAPPWWYSNVADILSFSQLDPLNFEVLLDVKSMWAIGWIGGNRILPKHIWKPISTGAIAPKSGVAWDPTSFAPDINVVATGPWRLKEYVALDHILLVKNSKGSTVTNNMGGLDPNADPTPVTSTYGYFKLNPLYTNVHVTTPTAYGAKLDPGFPATTVAVNLGIDLTNMWYGGSITVAKYVYVDGVLQSGPVALTLTDASTVGHVYTETLAQTFAKCTHTVKVAVKITSAGAWQNAWCNDTQNIWVTIPEDITGTYYVNTQLAAPDCKVDLKDVFAAGKAFGSVPGDAKWNTNADLNHDYKIDLKDYFAICKKFGKW